jgi:hypothetical protein
MPNSAMKPTMLVMDITGSAFVDHGGLSYSMRCKRVPVRILIACITS